MAPQWFIDLVEEIKRDLGVDAKLADTISKSDKLARTRSVSGGVLFQNQLEEAVSDTANPDMIEVIWRTVEQ